LPSIEIARDEIHLWETSLAVADEEVSFIEEFLSPDELVYADNYRVARARRQYVVSRGKLRHLLSRYLGMPAQSIRFGIEGAGKPVLEGQRTIDFNLTHSGQLVLYGVAAARPVGVDVEQVRPMERAVELAGRFFSAGEHEIVAAAAPEHRDRAFLSMWVRREAYAKALGSNFWRALASYHGPNAAHPPDSVGESATEYSVRVVDYSDLYVAAVAAAGSDWKVVRRGTV
jgi:4'-phosphopantetheinyl transferase